MRSKILVVEDNALLREQIIATLEIEDFEVISAANGIEAVAKAREHQPSLIISDIMMPGMDGLEALRQLRSNPELTETPVIFLTARVARKDIRIGMELGADDYITKPCEMKELLGAVRSRLNRHTETQKSQLLTQSKESVRILNTLPHEMLTPLTLVSGMSDILKFDLKQGSSAPDHSEEILDIIGSAGKRLEHLASNLTLHHQLVLAESDPEQAELFISKEVSNLVSSLTSTAWNIAARHNRLGDLCWESHGDFQVRMASRYLERALSEIIDNAFKFSLPSTPVTLSLQRIADEIEVSISDKGVGMTTEECSGLKPYVQWHREKREQQGMGLGFVIARRLVEHAAGSLIASPRDEGGVTVQLRLLSANPLNANQSKLCMHD
jgi:CheY-like chemotaxis protein